MNFIYNTPIKLNFPRIPFKSNTTVQYPKAKPISDGFASNPIYDNFGTKEQIENIAKTNPKIQQILNENKIPLQVNIEELEKLKYGHMNDTRVVAAKIYSSLPDELKKEVDLQSLQEAAIFHDYGKVLIPNSILNKAGKLNEQERKIMELHSELGYELLKNRGLLKEKTLNLVKYHHQNPKGNGYPAKGLDYEYDLSTQILTAADKYSALREKRSYKNPMAKYEAFEIIAQDVNNGNISQDVYTAMVRGL